MRKGKGKRAGRRSKGSSKKKEATKEKENQRLKERKEGLECEDNKKVQEEKAEHHKLVAGLLHYFIEGDLEAYSEMHLSKAEISKKN